ncbi:hypothetical protein Ctaglu_32510 [Clostridium tagluense]|uniref:WCX domain-containing protein n=1 Tax=Clostridium tagluense TaxID=360422 RepID=A0A401UQ49_9CLOT|nr:hypothetical protein Ctaglu_32510 [Clostridium tagluense]
MSSRRDLVNLKNLESSDDYDILQITSYGIEGIQAWLMGFGDKVEVLKPQSLREEMLVTAKNMYDFY